MPNIPELLAPAGSRDALEAALANGADAVYLGSALFGARSSAGFDAESLRDAIRFAHLYGKRVYVTVNTLVKHHELPAVRDTLRLLESLRADAVIVQDAGILRIIRTEFPALPVHASTQMSIHNATGARFLQSLGVSRVVLARECGMDAIRKVADTGMETEVFVHGALCVSVSGQCQCSAMLGGRSGNRGRCAQPCRLPYSYTKHTGAWLSPRDLCLRNDLPKLWSAGVSSFKIEGRLKRPEYVAVVTRSYRDAIDAMAESRFAPSDEDEWNRLKQVFHRGGFTRGYASGAQDADIINPASVSHEGLLLGGIVKVHQKNGIPLCDVMLELDLNDGDGLRIQGRGDQEIIYSGPDVKAGSEATLRLHTKANTGDAVYRLADEKQLSLARKGWATGMPRLPFDAVLSVYPGILSRLTLSSAAAAVTVEGEPAQVALDKPLDSESAKRAIAKSGGTPFVLREFEYEGSSVFLPSSALNALRRTGLDALIDALIASHETPAPLTLIKPASFGFEKSRRQLFAKSPDAHMLPTLLTAGADTVLYSPNDYTEETLQKELPLLPGQAFFCLPVQARDDTLAMLVNLARAYRLRITAGSIGQLGIFPGQISMAGSGIPVWNGESVHFLAEHGCVWQTLSRELSKDEIHAVPDTMANLLLPVYGRACLMLLNHCPERTQQGYGSGHADCTLCQAGKGLRGHAFTDRLGVSFPLVPLRLPEGCMAVMLNGQPLHLGIKAPVMSWLLDFTDEKEEDCIRIIRYYRALMDGTPLPELAVHGTMGRFESGVE